MGELSALLRSTTQLQHLAATLCTLCLHERPSVRAVPMPAAAEPTSTVQNQSTRQQMRQARGGIGKHVGSTFRKGWTRNRLRDGLRAGGSRRGDETKRSARRRG